MLRKITVAIALTGLMAGMAHAGILPGTGINGSLHDMNSVAAGTHDGFQRTCVFCHTPHNAREASAVVYNGPLWNRPDTALVPPAYTWQTPSNDANLFIDSPLVGPSRLCMSCHDGTIAYDSHGGANPTTGTPTLMGSNNHAYVRDLKITHPIGFIYDDAYTARGAKEVVPSTDGFLSEPSATFTAASFNTTQRTGLAKSSVKIADTMYQGYMTCASCHDVHNTVNVASDTGKSYNYFLRAREEGSAICLSCHIK